jgi:hypothetical protein
MKRFKKRIETQTYTSVIVNLSIFSLFLIITIIFFWKIILSQGVITMTGDWNIPQFSKQFKLMLEQVWYSWNPQTNFGIPMLRTSRMYHVWFFYFLTSFGVNGEAISKYVSIFVMAFAGYSMFYLCKQLRITFSSSITAGILYMTTPTVFDFLIVGYLNTLISYALLPLILLFFKNSLEKNSRFKSLILTSLFASLAYGGGLSFIFIISLMLLLFCLIYNFKGSYKRREYPRFRILFIVSCLSFSPHVFWLLPLIKEAFSGLAYHWMTLTKGTAPVEVFLYKERYANFINLVRLIGFTTGNFLRSAQSWNMWQFLSFLPTFLVFLPLIFKPKEKTVSYFAILSLIGITLSAGSKGPFGELWLGLLKNIPFFRVFTDPYKWIPLACLGYAVLFGISSEFIMQGLTNFLITFSKRRKYLISIHSKLASFFKVKIISSVLILLMFNSLTFFYAWPFFTGDFNGNLQTYDFGDQYEWLVNWLSNKPEDFRVLMLPAPHPTLYPRLKYPGRDLMAMYAGKSTIYAAEGVSHPPFVGFLLKTLHTNRTMHLGKLLGISNVKYIILDMDKITTFGGYAFNKFQWTHFTNEKLINTLNQQSDVHLIGRKGSILIYNNTEYLPHIFPVSKIGLVAGDLSTLISLSYTEKLKLNNLGLVFSNQLSPDDFRSLISPLM